MDATVRRAGRLDSDAVTATVCAAFHEDPLWSWVFPDVGLRPAQFGVWWRLLVDAGLRNDTVWVTPGCEAAAVWVAPGASELSPEVGARIPGLFDELVGERAPLVLDGLARFEAAHPKDEPHWYLGIVATHTAHRGHGLGVGVLVENLRRVDEQHLPAYLESSNPVNLERYQRLGFEPVEEFSMPEEGPVVTTMWRPAR